MNVTRRFLINGPLVLAMLFGITGCRDEDPPVHTLIISDVSLSGLSSAARLDEVAKQELVSAIDAEDPGDVVSLYAFGRGLTSSCQPITADFAKQDNSEQQDQLKENLKASAPTTYDNYVECVRDRATGGAPGPGSPVWGAVVEALAAVRATRPAVSTIVLVTDGCATSEGGNTCTAEMTQPGFAKSLIKELPASLKPDLSAIDTLIVKGLGQGTGMSSERVSTLREVLAEYAAATGTNVEFH